MTNISNRAERHNVTGDAQFCLDKLGRFSAVRVCRFLLNANGSYSIYQGDERRQSKAGRKFKRAEIAKQLRAEL